MYKRICSENLNSNLGPKCWSLRQTLFTVHAVKIPSDLSGQKAEQRANGISFHARPPQIQMFTLKTSPLVQVEA